MKKRKVKSLLNENSKDQIIYAIRIILYYVHYTKNTFKLHLQLYLWYRMPPSVHKILVRGPRAIRLASSPTGILSEETQETRNKDDIRFR